MNKTTIVSKNAFIIGLVTAIVLAFLFPQLGATGGLLNSELLTKVGVMLIFFIQGLSLPTKELGHGLLSWRLHVFVQGWNFIFSAILLMFVGVAVNRISGQGMGEGFYFLALLPTTISSAVALTTTAEGNVSGAIFNTTLSNLIGVFWVPTMAVFIFSATAGVPDGLLSGLLINLSWLILLPLFVGQICRPFVQQRKLFNILRPRFKTINNGIILFIVYAAFCNSVLSNTWSLVSTFDLCVLFIASIIAVGVIHFFVWKTAVYFVDGLANQLAAFFCGSQKTLAAGVPMGVAIFASEGLANNVDLGLLFIPLMLYHLMQLLVAGFVISRIER